MNINSNLYTFGFASIMVIVVAALLSITALSLQDRQDRNVELEKKQNILNSVKESFSREDSEKQFERLIKESVVLDFKGNKIEGGTAFDIDIAKELKKDPKDQMYPLNIYEKEGSKRFIIPLRGKGLWGPIWGYIAIENDFNKVYGAVFDHKSETPGLGAEINTNDFQKYFEGKEIYNKKGEFVSISDLKGVITDGDMHSVSGIAGGTITSDGVSDMLYERLEKYLPYFEKCQSELELEEMKSLLDTTQNNNDSIQ